MQEYPVKLNETEKKIFLNWKKSMRESILKNKFFVGQTASIKKVVRKEDVGRFAEITGDFYELHFDEELDVIDEIEKIIEEKKYISKNNCEKV